MAKYCRLGCLLCLALGAAPLSLGAEIPSPLDRFSQWTYVNGEATHYYDTLASGTPQFTLLLVHGWLGSGYNFRFLIELFPPSVRVIAPDLPGFGLSERAEGPYTMESLVAFLDGFTDALGLTRFVIAGSSMGGNITVEFIAAHPEKIDRVILIAADGLRGEEGPRLFWARLGPLVDLGATLETKNTIKRFLRKNVFYDEQKIPEELVDSIARSILTRQGRRLSAEVTKHLLGRNPVDEILPLLQQPTLLIWGANDPLLKPVWAERYLELLPHAALRRIDGCGHMPAVEAPEQTKDLILEFLDYRLPVSLRPVGEGYGLSQAARC